MKRIAVALFTIIGAGCAGKIHQETPACEMSGTAAEEILARATAAAAPAAEASRAVMAGGIIRYQIKMRIALDEHIISATAIPISSRDSYNFTVSDFGSLVIRGPEIAQNLAVAIKHEISNRCARN